MDRDDIRYVKLWHSIYTKYETCPMNQWAHIKTYKIRPNTYEIKYDTEEIRNKRTGHILKEKNGYVTLDINKKVNGKYLRRKFRVSRIHWNSWRRECILPCDVCTYVLNKLDNKSAIPMRYSKKYKEWDVSKMREGLLLPDNKIKKLYDNCTYYIKKAGS